MSNKIKLAGKLPGDKLVNGLDPLAEALAARWSASEVNKPAALLVVGIVRVREIKVVAGKDGREQVPTIEVSRIEPIGMLGAEGIDGLELATLAQHKILLDAAEARTGETALPIDVESADDARIEVIGEAPEGGAQIIPLTGDR